MVPPPPKSFNSTLAYISAEQFQGFFSRLRILMASQKIQSTGAITTLGQMETPRNEEEDQTGMSTKDTPAFITG